MAHLLGSQQASRPQEPGKELTQGNDGQIVGGRLWVGACFSGRAASSWDPGVGGGGRSDTSMSDSAPSPSPAHPPASTPPPCSPLGHWPVGLRFSCHDTAATVEDRRRPPRPEDLASSPGAPAHQLCEPQASCLTSQSLSVLLCKMGIIGSPTPNSLVVEGIRGKEGFQAAVNGHCCCH